MLLKRKTRNLATKMHKKTNKALEKSVKKEKKTIMRSIKIAADNGKYYLRCDIDKELTRIWFRSQGFTVKPNDGIIWTDIIQW